MQFFTWRHGAGESPSQWFDDFPIPSYKHPLMGQSSVNMPFFIAMLNNQRIYHDIMNLVYIIHYIYTLW